MTSFMHMFRDSHVLIVEDEYFLADETRRLLEDAGAVVAGPVASVREALMLLDEERVDAAILDIHLGDELVFPVAEELNSRGIPFVFATGYDRSLIPSRYSGFALCEKPTELSKIAFALFATPDADGLH